MYSKENIGEAHKDIEEAEIERQYFVLYIGQKHVTAIIDV